MWSNEQLELRGHDGRTIHNRFYRHDEGGDGLTVIVAGFAYTLESPYLFYSKHAPFSHGYDVLAVDFQYSRTPDFLEAPGREQEAWFRDDVQALADFLAGQNTYRRLSFIGKSIGTTAVFMLLQDATLLGTTESVVWLTPAQKMNDIINLVVENDVLSLFVYGTKDRYAAGANLDRLTRQPHVTTLVVPDGDHALETGDAAAATPPGPGTSRMPVDIRGWLSTFASPYLNRVAPEEREQLVKDVVTAAKPHIQDSSGEWTADYVRLRFRARRA